MGRLRDLFVTDPTEEEVKEILADLEKMGIHYDYTVASKTALIELLEWVKGPLLHDAVIEHLRTEPITHMQYQLLEQLASAALRKERGE